MARAVARRAMAKMEKGKAAKEKANRTGGVLETERV